MVIKKLGLVGLLRASAGLFGCSVAGDSALQAARECPRLALKKD